MKSSCELLKHLEGNRFEVVEVMEKRMWGGTVANAERGTWTKLVVQNGIAGTVSLGVTTVKPDHVGLEGRLVILANFWSMVMRTRAVVEIIIISKIQSWYVVRSLLWQRET